MDTPNANDLAEQLLIDNAALLQENERLKDQINDLESLRNELISNQLGHRLEVKELDTEIEQQAKRIEELEQGLLEQSNNFYEAVLLKNKQIAKLEELLKELTL